MARFSSFNTWITFSAKLIVLMKRKYGREGCEKECERVIKYGRENMYVYERVCEKLPGSRFYRVRSHTRSLSLMLSPSYPFTHTLSFTLSRIPSLSLMFSQPYTLFHTLCQILALSHIHPLSCIHSFTYSLSLSLPVSPSHARSLIVSLTQNTLSQIISPTVIFSLPHILSKTLCNTHPFTFKTPVICSLSHSYSFVSHTLAHYLSL